jgi:hypothetical protein
MPDLTIYQAVSNGYDKPRPIRNLPAGVDHQLIVAAVEESKARLWNRYHKIKAPPTYRSQSLYLDGNITPKGDLSLAIDYVDGQLGEADIAFMRHPERRCSYAEIEACEALKKITPKQAQLAFESLKAIGLPKNYGLWACGIIARRHGVEWVRQFQDVWFDLCQLVPRDQLWMAAALYRTEKVREAGRMKTVEMNVWKNPVFSWEPHTKK